MAARNCVASAKSLITYLRHAKDDLKWDLADICLSQCEGVVKTMSSESALDLRRRNIRAMQVHNMVRNERPIGGILNSSLQERSGAIAAHTSHAPVTDLINRDGTTNNYQDDSHMDSNLEIPFGIEDAGSASFLQSQEAQTSVLWSSMFPVDFWSIGVDEYNI